MQRVSSQLTIVLRIVIPTVWLTTILSFVVLLGMAVRGKAGLFGNPFIWIGLLIILGSGFTLIKWLLWRFYRVDMDQHYLYVSNYFNTYKYPLHDIEAIIPSATLPTRIFCIVLKSRGTFGKKIWFLASQALWQDYLLDHPDVKQRITIKPD